MQENLSNLEIKLEDKNLSKLERNNLLNEKKKTQ